MEFLFKKGEKLSLYEIFILKNRKWITETLH